MKTLGQMAYEIFALALGKRGDWEMQPQDIQAAWEETAICIQYIPKVLGSTKRLIEEEITSKMKVQGGGSG